MAKGMTMRNAAWAVVLGLAAMGAQAQEPVKKVVVPAEVPYSNVEVIDSAIVKECNLPGQVGQRLQNALKAAGIEATPVAGATPKAGDTVLLLEIAQAQSSGNAFVGHKKSVTVSGKLYRKGEQVAKFVSTRNSGGGFGAGYKGSCAVLVRCAEAVAQDAARWLSSPVDGARLGDAR
jgi:hypothetical protein